MWMGNSYSHKEAPWGVIDSRENMNDGPTFMQGKEKRRKRRVIPVHRIIHGFPLRLLSECYICVRLNQSCIPALKKLIFFKSVHTHCHDHSHTVVCLSSISQHWGNSATLSRLFWGSPSCIFGREAAKGCSFSPAFLELEGAGFFSLSFPFLT